jgi:drug/metabolite transporter (DMT)-like permease
MAEHKPEARDWALLLLLSLIWGGSFFFVGVAVKELPAILIVFARVAIAAAILVPIHLALEGGLPRDSRTWISCGVMGLLNNVLPFTAISFGQHSIGSGLAAVLNATSPMFGAAFMALFGLEALTARKAIALILGLAGVAVLQGGNFNGQAVGVLAVTFASACYGLSACWSKVRLMGVKPLTAATCQLFVSSAVMAVLTFTLSTPSAYASVSLQTWAALVGLAAFSTSIAYLLFFNILRRNGPSFTILVTLIIPVSAVLLGVAFLHETISTAELAGAAIIALALALIDGRLPRRMGLRLA